MIPDMRLYRRKSSGRYYVEFSRNRQRSLKTTDPREAKRLYHAIRAGVVVALNG